MSITKDKEVVFKFIREAIQDARSEYSATSQSKDPVTLFNNGFLYGILFQTQNHLERYVDDAISGKTSIQAIINQKTLAVDYHLFAHELQDGSTSCEAVDQYNSVLDEKINKRIMQLYDQVISVVEKLTPSPKGGRCDGKDTKIDPSKMN